MDWNVLAFHFESFLFCSLERIEEECFGISRGSSIIGLAVGLMIVLAGLSLLLKELYQIAIPW
jgi:hypothetical protein